MSASILLFARGKSKDQSVAWDAGCAPAPRNWGTQELAELYRVRDMLQDAGLRVKIETGLSDEGDPWVVFEQTDTGDAVVHIARIGGEMVVVNTISGQMYKGGDFRAITSKMLDDAPLVLPRHSDEKVVLHPRSVLTAFVAAAFILTDIVRPVNSAMAAEAPAEIGDNPGNNNGAAFSEPHQMSAIIARLAGREGVGIQTAPVTPNLFWSMTTACAVAAGLALDEILSDISVGDISVGEEFALRGDDVLAPGSGGREAADPSSVMQFAENAADAPFVSAMDFDHLLLVQDVSINALYDDPVRKADPVIIDTAPESHDSAGPSILNFTSIVPELNPQFFQNDVQAKNDHVEIVVSNEPVTVTFNKQTIINAIIVQDFGTWMAPNWQENIEDIKDIEAFWEKSDQQGASGPTSDKQEALEPEVLADLPQPPDSPVYEMYFNGSQNGGFVFVDGQVDVLFYDGGEAEIYNFRFGEDIILINGKISATDWIVDVDIQGNDVKIVGIDGGVLWLYDSLSSLV